MTEVFQLANGVSVSKIKFGPDALGYTPRVHVYRTDIISRALRKLKRIVYDEPGYVSSVANAFCAGFDTIDYSASYGDGSLIARAIKKSGIKRENILITTRISNRAQFQNTVEAEVQRQLEGFRTDYIDVLMFHWPVTGLFEETWLKMLDLRERGYCRALGVANCHEHHLLRLKQISGEYPLINQVEVHPLFTQADLRAFCKRNRIQIEAYSPTGRQDDRLIKSSVLKRISSKYKKDITQVILRWHIQNGVIPVIRTLNHEHQKSDINIFDFALTDCEMREIDKMNINSRLRYDPDNCDFTAL